MASAKEMRCGSGCQKQNERQASMVELREINKTRTRPAAQGRMPQGPLLMFRSESHGEGSLRLSALPGSGKSSRRISWDCWIYRSADPSFSMERMFHTLAQMNRHRCATQIGFVLQTFPLLPRTTALENVELPLLYSQQSRIDGLGQRALQPVGLSSRVHSQDMKTNTFLSPRVGQTSASTRLRTSSIPCCAKSARCRPGRTQSRKPTSRRW
jgi:hypothetical protein